MRCNWKRRWHSRAVRYFIFIPHRSFWCATPPRKPVRRLMQAGDAELTRIEGPAPDIGEAVAAAGTISLFGTKRVVELPGVEPAAMGEKDVEALCDLMQSLENAVMVLTTVFKDDKAKSTKKAKLLISTAAKAGVALEFEKPSPGAVRDFLAARAQALGHAPWHPARRTRWCSGVAQTCTRWKMNLQKWPPCAVTPR